MTEDIRRRHAKLIRDYLKVHGLTQTDLADLMEVTQGNVGHWLSRRQRVTPERASQLENITHGVLKKKDFYPELF